MKPLQGPDRAVLLLWHAAVIGQQALVPERVLTLGELALGLVDEKGLKASYLLQSSQWQQAPREGGCRVLDLSHARVLHGAPSLGASRSLRLSLLSSAPQPLELQIQPLWPHRRGHLAVPCDQQRLVDWMAALIDSTLLERPLQKTRSLHTKWLRWLDTRLPNQAQCAHLVALTLARHWSPQPTRYGKLDWPWAQEWIAFQLQLFVAQPPEPDALARDLQAHAAWIAAEGHRDWHHAWQLCQWPDGSLWRRDLDSEGLERYTLSARWSPLLPFRLSVKRGCVSVDRPTFDAKVAPHLYRLVLQDLLYEARCQALQGEYDVSLCDQAWSHDRDWLNCATQLWVELRDCNDWVKRWRWLADAQCYDSPVQRHVVKWLRVNDSLPETTAGQRLCIAEHVPDIEDLVALAPPCLQRGMQQEHYRCWDRFNLPAYLRDAGYSLEKVVKYLARNQPGEESTFASRYRACERANQSWGRVSSSCGTLMNARFDDARLRCPYEEESNEGRRRTDHTKEEKQTFCDTCVTKARFKNPVTVYHPLDFVEARLRERGY